MPAVRPVDLAGTYGRRFLDTIRRLEEGLEDSLAFFDFPGVDRKKISSNNRQEQLNLDIRRRSRMVGVLLSVESFARLTISYLVEYGGLGTERSYIRGTGTSDRLARSMS